MDLSDINWLAVLASALLFFGMGAIWYGPVFGKAWQHATGLSDAELKDGGSSRIFAAAFIMSVIIALGMAIFLQSTVAQASFSGADGALIGLMVGVFFILPSTVMNYIFARRPISLILVDAFYHIIAYTLVGMLLGAWQ